MANMKVISFALLVVLLLCVDMGEAKGKSLCCNTHPKFGRCDTEDDEDRCNRWCLDGCDNGRGGWCKPLSHRRKQCHCYC
ncbi:PREDICTED: putative defensin-like protein 23 [Tarenaya hassleriana]|uniref:putative defensin-like protein 23 n=1 Tax=Tarenaya hassleriana TaxID=28532 RepID=UPI0008FD6747|nr:PREDICTED: putative defensin-like protein 23 [Tarenaya hassleriana]